MEGETGLRKAQGWLGVMICARASGLFESAVTDDVLVFMTNPGWLTERVRGGHFVQPAVTVIVSLSKIRNVNIMLRGTDHLGTREMLLRPISNTLQRIFTLTGD